MKMIYHSSDGSYSIINAIPSLIAHIRKRYGGKFVIDVTFLEWEKAMMIGLNELLLFGRVEV